MFDIQQVFDGLWIGYAAFGIGLLIIVRGVFKAVCR